MIRISTLVLLSFLSGTVGCNSWLEERVTVLEHDMNHEDGKVPKTIKAVNQVTGVLENTSQRLQQLENESSAAVRNTLSHMPPVSASTPYYGASSQAPSGAGYYNQPVIPAHVPHQAGRAPEALIPDTLNGQPVYVRTPVVRYGPSGGGAPGQAAPTAPPPATPPPAAAAPPSAPSGGSSSGTASAPAASGIASMTQQINDFAELMRAIEGLKNAFGASSQQQQHYAALESQVEALKEETSRLIRQTRTFGYDLKKIATATERYINLLKERGYTVKIEDGAGEPKITYRHTWTSYGMYRDNTYYKYVFGWPGHGSIIYCYRYPL